MTTIQQAALREQAAERNRVQAETEWRQAWWQTTLALGTLAEGDKQGIHLALDTAQRILGQSRNWLSSRRRLGRMLASAASAATILNLPPRLAIAYCEAKGDPAKAVAVLRDAEARQLSLRDFAAELGVQPQSWLRENEQHRRPVTAEQFISQPVAVQVTVIRRALQNTQVAHQVFPPLPARRTFPLTPLPLTPLPGLPAGPDVPLRDGPGPRRPLSQSAADPGQPEVIGLLMQAHEAVEQAFRLAALRSLAGDAPVVLTALAAVEQECESMRKYLTGADVDEAVERILADG